MAAKNLGKIFTILNKPEACNFIEKETLTPLVSCEICKTFKNTFFIVHLRTAVSETVTENSLGNSTLGEQFSARDEKLHIISIFPTRLTESKYSARAENLHSISLLDV